MFVDSDDWLLPTTVADCVHYIETYNADLVEFGYSRVTEYNIEGASNFEEPQIIENGDLIESRCDHIACNKLYKTEIIKNNNLRFLYRRFEDTLFTRKYAFLSRRAVVIPTDYYRYYVNPQSITSTVGQNVIEDNSRTEEVVELYNQYGCIENKNRYLSISHRFLLNRLIPLSHQPHNEFRFTCPDGEFAQYTAKTIELYNKNSLYFRLYAYFHMGIRTTVKLILRYGI